MSEVNFVDTTFRDGHASLWAEGMTTGMMLPVAEQMDAVGFNSMEITALSHFKKCVRELENVLERMITLSEEKVHFMDIKNNNSTNITSLAEMERVMIKKALEKYGNTLHGKNRQLKR